MTPGRKSNLDQLFLMNLWYMHFPIFCFFDSDVSALLQSSVCICSSYWIISTEEVRLRVWSPSKGKEERWRARLGRSLPERSCKVTESLQDEVGGQRTPVSSRKGPTLPGTLLCPPGRSLPEYPCHTQPVTERNHGRQGPSTNAAEISKRDSWVLRQVDSLHYPPVEICATDHQRGKGVSTLGKTFPD